MRSEDHNMYHKVRSRLGRAEPKSRLWKDGAVITDTGEVVKIRPFPPNRDPIDLGDGWKLVRIPGKYLGKISVGWVTEDEGKTFDRK